MANLAVAFDLLAKDRNASKTFDKVGDSAGHAGKVGKAAGLAIAAGLVAAGVAALKFGKSSISAFENSAAGVKRLQRVAGGSVEDVSRLAFAVKESGVSAGSFESALKKLSTGLTKADKAGKAVTVGYKYQIQQMPYLLKGHIAYHDVLKRVAVTQTPAAKSALDLGFAYRDAHGQLLPMSQLLPKLADKFSKMPAGAEKSAMAVKLFGRSGLDLLPFLNRGAAGIAELEKQSDKLGHTLTGSDLAAIKENAEAHKKFHAAVEGLQIQVGRLLLPVLARFATFSTSVLVPVIANMTKLVQTRLAPAFHDFLAGMRGAEGNSFFTRLGTDAAKVQKTIVTAFTVAKQKVSEFFKGFQGEAKVKIAGPGRKGETLDKGAITGAGTLGAKVRSAFDSLKVVITSEVIPAVLTLGKNIADLGVTIAKNLFPVLASVVGKLYDARAVLIPLAAIFIALNAAVSAATTIFEGITAVNDAYTTVVEKLTAVKAFFVTTTNAETGAVTASGLSQVRARVATIASTIATTAASVATRAYTAVQWLLNAAMTANPIGLVVAGLALLVGGLVLAWKNSETFRTVVKAAFDGISTAATFMWEKVLKPTFKFLVEAFLLVAGTIVHAAAGAFGWIPGIGGKLKKAAKEFDAFKADVNKSLDGIKDKEVKINVALASGGAGKLIQGRGGKMAVDVAPPKTASKLAATVTSDDRGPSKNSVVRLHPDDMATIASGVGKQTGAALNGTAAKSSSTARARVAF